MKRKALLSFVCVLLILAMSFAFYLFLNKTDPLIPMISMGIRERLSDDQENNVTIINFNLDINLDSIDSFNYIIDNPDISNLLIDSSSFASFEPLDTMKNNSKQTIKNNGYTLVEVYLKYDKDTINLFDEIKNNPDIIRIKIVDSDGRERISPAGLQFDEGSSPKSYFLF